MTTLITSEKSIVYDHGDYKMTLDGRYIGHASTYHQAKISLDQVARDMLTHGDVPDALIDIPQEPQPPTPGGPEPGEWAVTLQSIAIESRLTVCGYCKGIHHVQQCPALRYAVAVPVTAVELGGTLCGILWCDPPGFVQLIERLTPERRAEYACAYLAFLHTERPDCTLTVPQVLERWLPAVAEAMHG